MINCIYLIPVSLIAFLGGVMFGVKLVNWVMRNRLEGIKRVKRME